MFFACHASRRPLHSFPTRRSSDLGHDALVRAGVLDHQTGLLARIAATVGNILTATQKNPVNDKTIRTLGALLDVANIDRKSTRLNSSHVSISYAVFCLKKKKSKTQ